MFKSIVLVLGLVRNIEKHIFNLKQTCDNISCLYNTKFFFFTNNNNDNTINIMKEWEVYDKNINVIYGHDEEINIYNRTSKLSKYRNIVWNNAMKQCDNNTKYVIIFDTDLNIVIPQNIIENFSYEHQDNNWDIITSNTLCGQNNLYYDSFALRFMDDPIQITNKFPLFDKCYGKNTDWVTENYSFDKWIKVKSAFGGFIIINNKNNLYTIDSPYNEDIKYDECEHISFNTHFDNIYISPNFKYNNLPDWK